MGNGLVVCDIHKFALLYANSNYSLHESIFGDLLCVKNKEVIQVVNYDDVSEEVELLIAEVKDPEWLKNVTVELRLVDLLYKVRKFNELPKM